jgi:hypothetical protein
MNLPELLVLLFLSAVLFMYLWRSSRQVRNAAIITIAIVPALYLSIETTSQFLTVDEIYIIRETADLDFHYINQWYAGANRTTDVFLGAFSRVVRTVFAPGEARLKMALKLAHFAAGFLILLLIHRLGTRWVSAPGGFWPWSIMFFYGALLLPVSAVALKVFNYDLFSMNLGILALFLIAAAFREKRSRYALLAVVSSYLAAQEKLAASPILVFCCALYGIYFVSNGSGFSAVKMFIFDLRGVAVALATGLLSVGIVALAGTGDFPRSFITRTIDPFIIPLWQVLRFAFGITVQNGFSYMRYGALLLAACVLTFTLSMALSISYRALLKSPMRSRLSIIVRRTNYLLAAAVLTAGVVSTFFVRMHFGMFSAETHYPFIHTSPFNNTITWFGATDVGHHLLMAIGYAYAVFVNALPSVFWLMVAFVFFVGRKKPSSTFTPWYVEAAFTVILLVPLAWGISQFPLSNRYLNIFIFLMSLIVGIKFIHTVSLLPKKTAVPVISMAVVLLAAEIMPFKPVFTAFRPVWSSFPDTIPEPTLGNPSWVGWGEDVMVAGKKIEKLLYGKSTGLCQDSDGIVLYTLYAGDYLTASGNLPFAIKYVLKDSSFYRYDAEKELARSGKTCLKSQVAYDTCALFLVNRYNFIIDALLFPRTVEPLFTIRYRGYPQAWVWKGDELRKAGVFF